MIAEATQKLDLLLHGTIPEQIDTAALAGDELELATQLNMLFGFWREIRDIILPLSRGDLDGPQLVQTKNYLSSPFKQLHSQLKHLTWQAKQVAAGDYSQRVEFMGEFAQAFNAMVVALDEKDKALNSKIAHLEDSARPYRHHRGHPADLLELQEGAHGGIRLRRARGLGRHREATSAARPRPSSRTVSARNASRRHRTASDSRMTEVTTFYLEMTDRAQIRPCHSSDPRFVVREAVVPQWQVNRFLYFFVGEQWDWVDKRPWSDRQWEDYAGSGRPSHLPRLLRWQHRRLLRTEPRGGDRVGRDHLLRSRPSLHRPGAGGRPSDRCPRRAPGSGMRAGSGCTPVRSTIRPRSATTRRGV